MKLEKVKKTKTKSKMTSGRNLFKKIFAVLLSIGVFAGSYHFISIISADFKETEEVLRIKAKEGLPSEKVITIDDVERYKIIRKEYTSDMVRSEDLEEVLEKFTTNNLRHGAILHYDEYSTEKTPKNVWTYPDYNPEIADKEILIIPFNYLESGGDILTPGDKVRIRVKYEAEKDTEEDYEEYYGDDPYYTPTYTPAKKEKIEVTEILFDSIVVADMLNSKGHSIYEVYREVLRYPESERQKLLKSKDFMNNIVPKSLALAATPEDVNRYMQYKSNSKGILITLLPRDRNSTILDQLPTLEKEIEVWLDNQKK